MKLSVIILNFQVRYFLEQCIVSVVQALDAIDGEIIVVDNASDDGSAEMVAKRFPHVKLIRNSENTGFPKGNNIGVAAAKGDYICILNPDTVVAEDTFVKILAFAESKNDLGIVGVKLIDGTGNFLPESKRGVPTPFVAFTKISGLHRFSGKFFGRYYATHLNPDKTGKTDILVGAFMVMKRQTYLEAGGFDEDCFMYSDDIDLSYTILKSGKSNYYFGETSVIHYKGESTVKDSLYLQRFRDAMNFFYKKHFRTSALFDVFMKTGAYFFALYKKGKTSQKTAPIEKYVLISSNENLRLRVENLLGKNVIRIGDATENRLNSLADAAQTIIIFDNNLLSFKTIISLMEKYHGSGIRFRILPADSDYMIGSDSSNDRGEVLNM